MQAASVPSNSETIIADRPLAEQPASFSPDEIERGLFPRTLADLAFRAPLFSRMAVAQEALRKKRAGKR